MINPSLDELIKQVDSRYTLVTVAAKRARRLLEEVDQQGDERSVKAVSIALEEIQAGKIKIERIKTGIK